MRFESYHPGPPFSRFVDFMWRYENGPQAHARERGLPCGTSELVIDLSDDWQPRSPSAPSAPSTSSPLPRRPHAAPGTVLCGPRTRPFRVETDRSLRLLGVRFTPGGATPFFAPPAGELRDSQAPLNALWGRQATELEDRFRVTSLAEAQFPILEQALIAHAIRPLERHPAVAFALQAFMACQLQTCRTTR